MLQIVDLASNNFTGQLPRESLSAWKAMMDETPSKLNHLQFDIPTIQSILLSRCDNSYHLKV
jgi:hypothetical protein